MHTDVELSDWRPLFRPTQTVMAAAEKKCLYKQVKEEKLTLAPSTTFSLPAAVPFPEMCAAPSAETPPPPQPHIYQHLPMTQDPNM